MKLRSGATIPHLSVQEAEQKHYLTRNILNKMHLMPSGDPIAYWENADGSITYYVKAQNHEGNYIDSSLSQGLTIWQIPITYFPSSLVPHPAKPQATSAMQSTNAISFFITKISFYSGGNTANSF
jgi:hypothetical protein